MAGSVQMTGTMDGAATVARDFNPWRSQPRSRYGYAGMLSAALHAILALLVMAVVVRTPIERPAIRVSLLEPPAPPPPPAASAPANPIPPVSQAKPQPHLIVRPKERPHIRPPVEPAAVAPVPSAAAEPATSGGESPGGVIGGVSGGIAGGTVGGTGHRLVAADELRIQPVAISKVMPQYPPVARVRGVEGQVVLEAIVATDGHIEPDVSVIQSVPLLDAAAIAAVRQWRFRPVRDRDGTPLRVTLRVPVRFVLR